jgi:spore coat polysaccharide biosynthesis predicted glycosyltransferase SpsG
MTGGAPGSVLLRADGGPGIGLGHVVRCAALAEALAEAGFETHAAVRKAPPGVTAPLARAGAAVHDLPGDLTLERDAAATIEAARATGARAVVADLCALNTRPDGSVAESVRYLETLAAAGLPVFLMDDLRLLPRLPVAAVINPNLGAEAGDYSEAAPSALRLLGARYAPVRRAFAVARRTVPPIAPSARRLLVTLGGGASAFAEEALAALARIEPPFEITAVIGPGVLHPGAPGGARIVEAPADPASLMAAADLIVSGGGTTKYEIATLGIPSVLVPLTDHQVPLTAAFARAGIARDLARFDADALVDAVAGLRADADERLRMRERGRALVDGMGAGRIVAAIAEQLGKGGSDAPRG